MKIKKEVILVKHVLPGTSIVAPDLQVAFSMGVVQAERYINKINDGILLDYELKHVATIYKREYQNHQYIYKFNLYIKDTQWTRNTSL